MVLKSQKGFTLIELLVVVAIIGILAAIAIPQFASYRKQAFCARAESDVKNAVTTYEAYYAANEKYTGATVTNSAGVTLTPTVTDQAITTITGTHANCDHNGDGTAGDVFTYTGATGNYSW